MAAPRRWLFVLLVVASVVVLVVVASTVTGLLALKNFSIQSGSMGNTLQPNDSILVNKWAGSPKRGEIVVFVVPASWRASPGEVFPKRVFGIAGDRVLCCQADGRITVNGYALTEAYLYPGDAPSTLRFDVKVPAGRIFVLGDHREISGDSRFHLDDQGGSVPLASVVGTVVAIYLPASRATRLSVPEVFSHVPSQ
jgi:signal peptidase I